jgi:5'-nucleotidase
MVTAAGVRVGIVGLLTDVTLSATMAANTRGLAIAPLAPALAAEAQKLRAAGASVVIAVAHAGGVCNAFDDPHDLSSCNANEEIFKVARAIPAGAVDVIVAGHRHYEIAHEVAGLAIIESRSSGRTFGRVDLTVDAATHHVLDKRIFRPHDICAFERPDGACAAQSDVSAEPAMYEGRAVVASREIDTILAPAIARADQIKAVTFPAEISMRCLRCRT